MIYDDEYVIIKVQQSIIIAAILMESMAIAMVILLVMDMESTLMTSFRRAFTQGYDPKLPV